MTKSKVFLRSEIDAMEKNYRVNLINSIHGFKSANLIGTRSIHGIENLAIFNSVMHIGANPPLIGFIQRPASVNRHTLENLMETGFYTINAIREDMIEQSHQTAARYPEGKSEFEATQLTPIYHDDFKAPFVGESHLQIAVKWVENIRIMSNDTILVVGEIMAIYLRNEEVLSNDGFINHEQMNNVAISGLDSYYKTQKLARFSYAKPDKNLEQI